MLRDVDLLPFTNQPNFIFGPSHALRWSIHVREGVVACGVAPENIVGSGGVPIWNKKLFNTARGKVAESARLAVFVGDFRFGNAICLRELDQNNDLMQDGFLAIDPKALSTENDVLMLELGLKGCLAWHHQFGARIRFVFWCLFARQIFDRIAGRYIFDKKYKHPTFNYSDVITRLPGLNVVDLQPLFRLPMHEVLRLFIDSSAHPSYIGYLLLNSLLVEGKPAIDAYHESVEKFEEELLLLASEIYKSHAAPIILTGRSVWLDTFVRYMGAQGSTKLASKGIILAPLDRTAAFQYSVDNLPDGISIDECKVFVFSARGVDFSGILAQKTKTSPEAWRCIPVIDWESAAEPIIISQRENPRFTYGSVNPVNPERVFNPILEAHMVELGPLGIPTWSGLRHVLKTVGEMENAAKICTGDFRFEGDVLLSNGVAFLIGGNHSVLKYASGYLKPSEQSLKNFSSNMGIRKKLTDKSSISFSHVIFPDKHSVLDGAFPLRPVKRLGDYYLSALSPSARKSVIYPVDILKNEENAFWPLDTHLTDHGSLTVLRAMLESVGVQAEDALAHVEKRINRPVNWTGDLGSKFIPPLRQDGILLNPDWTVEVFRSNVGFNDGLIDILLNPGAAHDCTVLLFGDSFFRMMLQHLSAVFSRVICLRTRFMHPELLPLVKPDIVFTGNAERYLSHVVSDDDAHSFFLYPHMRSGIDVKMEEGFLEAWVAITSSGSDRYRNFLKKFNFN